MLTAIFSKYKTCIHYKACSLVLPLRLLWPPCLFLVVIFTNALGILKGRAKTSFYSASLSLTMRLMIRVLKADQILSDILYFFMRHMGDN